ncbi:MAG: c-type cytochrome [Beijerinckiaceae bacterium]|jgi:cytochrome c
MARIASLAFAGACAALTGLLVLAGPVQAQASRSAGEALVKERCAACHATGRSGASPNPKAPPLREIARKYRPSDLEEAFAEGVMVSHQAVDMPAFELEPAQIDALVAYLRALRR